MLENLLQHNIFLKHLSFKKFRRDIKEETNQNLHFPSYTRVNFKIVQIYHGYKFHFSSLHNPFFIVIDLVYHGSMCNSP
jgi:hypothetical protein